MFPSEMADEPSQVIAPLDGDTAERLLSGRLDPDDAPPGYAEVARLLRAAAAPADQAEPTGQAAAMNAFRAHPRRVQSPGRPTRPRGPGGVPGRQGAARERAPGARGRLVALALAGVVAAAGVGVWTAGGAPFPGELRSPSGGPSAGGPGSGTPGSGTPGSFGNGSFGSGSGGNGSGAAGSLRPLRPGLGSASGTAGVAGGRPPALPTAGERAAARHGGGVTARGGGSAHGSRPTWPDRQTRPRSKSSKPKPPKPKATNAHVSTPKGSKG